MKLLGEPSSYSAIFNLQFLILNCCVTLAPSSPALLPRSTWGEGSRIRDRSKLLRFQLPTLLGRFGRRQPFAVLVDRADGDSHQVLRIEILLGHSLHVRNGNGA